MLADQSPRLSITRRFFARARSAHAGSSSTLSTARVTPAAFPGPNRRAPSPSLTHSRFPSMSLTTGTAPLAIASSNESEVESEREAER